MSRHLYVFVTITLWCTVPLMAQQYVDESSKTPNVAQLIEAPSSVMAPVIERYADDRAVLHRRYDALFLVEREERLQQFYETWENELDAIKVDALGVSGRLDYVLLRHELGKRQHQLQRERRYHAEMKPRAVADSLTKVVEHIEAAMERIGEAEDNAERIAYRAVGATEVLADQLEEWYDFYDGYNPIFTWWVEAPFEKASETLEEYEVFLKEEVVGLRGDDDDPILGDPIGEEALRADFYFEIISYSSEESIEIAEQELAWGEEQMEQPLLVQELAKEGVEFVRNRTLLTVPPLSEEVWRMTMLTPEWQEVAPVFHGGEVVRIALPASEMPHDNKLMSIRGNNRHFPRALVRHELIPGHHLQQFMMSRYNTHRNTFLNGRVGSVLGKPALG